LSNSVDRRRKANVTSQTHFWLRSVMLQHYKQIYFGCLRDICHFWMTDITFWMADIT